MSNIFNLHNLLLSLSPVLDRRSICHLFDLLEAFFCVNFHTTTRSLSRHTQMSLRSIFRFLAKSYDWTAIRTQLFSRFEYAFNEEYVLVADETTEGKSRNKTFGISHFYCSTQKQPIKGICFFAMALVCLKNNKAYTLGVEQVIKTEADKERLAAAKAVRVGKQSISKAVSVTNSISEQASVAKEVVASVSQAKSKHKNKKKADKKTKKNTATKSKKASKQAVKATTSPQISTISTESSPSKPIAKKPAGRPKGSKNQPKTENVTMSYRTFSTLFLSVIRHLLAICKGIVVKYVVVDSAYSTADYAALVAQHGLYLVGRFKSNTKICLPAKQAVQGTEQAKKQGRKPIYGQDIDPKQPPKEYLVSTKKQDGHQISVYSFEGYAKGCFGAQLLRIVIVHCVRLSDNAQTSAILFSTDPKITAEKLQQLYHLRFQIEFEFRDSKQYFGLSHFKNYTPNNLTNFVNLSFTACLVSKIYLRYYRKHLNLPSLSIIDLKNILRTRKQLKNVLKIVAKCPNTIFNEQFCDQFLPNDLINAA